MTMGSTPRGGRGRWTVLGLLLACSLTLVGCGTGSTTPAGDGVGSNGATGQDVGAVSTEDPAAATHDASSSDAAGSADAAGSTTPSTAASSTTDRPADAPTSALGRRWATELDALVQESGAAEFSELSFTLTPDAPTPERNVVVGVLRDPSSGRLEQWFQTPEGRGEELQPEDDYGMTPLGASRPLDLVDLDRLAELVEQAQVDQGCAGLKHHSVAADLYALPGDRLLTLVACTFPPGEEGEPQGGDLYLDDRLVLPTHSDVAAETEALQRIVRAATGTDSLVSFSTGFLDGRERTTVLTGGPGDSGEDFQGEPCALQLQRRTASLGGQVFVSCTQVAEGTMPTMPMSELRTDVVTQLFDDAASRSSDFSMMLVDSTWRVTADGERTYSVDGTPKD